MNSMYKYAIEEKWTNIDSLGISQEFYRTIQKSKYNLIEEKESSFKFIYVGILVYKDELLLILPKYYNEKYSGNKLECMKQLILVFKKLPTSVIHQYKDFLIMSRDIDDEYISEIAIADYLIKDYIDNGYYTRNISESKLNVNGKIDWGKTINSMQPIISNGYPIYNNYYAIRNNQNNNNIIYKIHYEVVNLLIQKYGDLLGYKIKGRSSNGLKSLGNNKTISSIIKSELQHTYNDRNINLLKCIYNFFNPSREKSNKGLNLYGTTSFNLVWEFVCGYIFENEYDTFKECIPNPKWQAIGGVPVENIRNILKPDIIRSEGNNIIIIDAKYYSISLNNDGVVGNPGSYDIVKQYTYEIALRKKYKNHNIINLLLYPKELDYNIKLFGYVVLEIFDLDPILNVYISPKYVLQLFLNSERLKLDEIKLIINLKVSKR